MITFYRTENCAGCGEIQQALEDLSLAHDTVLLGSAADLPDDLRDQGPLPVMVDGDEVIQGYDDICEHMKELEEFRDLWYKFQSDACYCAEDGGIA